MRNQADLSIPQASEIANLDLFIARKNGTFGDALKLIRDQVVSAYANYTNCLVNLSYLTPLNYIEVYKDALISCYEQETDTLSGLKQAIKEKLSNVDVLVCPYCNVRAPSQFDHYLPKSVYSEFSVLSKNLIWVCSDCNKAKKNIYYGVNRTLHTTHDVLPDQQFLFCEMDAEGVSIDFCIIQPDGVSIDLYLVIERHFKSLNLRELYVADATKKVGEFKGAWKKKLQRGEPAAAVIYRVSEDLHDRLESLAEQYGNNYHEAALIRALLANVTTIINSLL